jgi:hypothetical protein
MFVSRGNFEPSDLKSAFVHRGTFLEVKHDSPPIPWLFCLFIFCFQLFWVLLGTTCSSLSAPGRAESILVESRAAKVALPSMQLASIALSSLVVLVLRSNHGIFFMF